MAIGRYTKKVSTNLKGKSLQMFRFDCVDSEVCEAVKLREIVVTHYRNTPPLGFKKEINGNS